MRAHVVAKGVKTMGDENFAPLNGGFLFKASDDGEWENVGYIGEDGITLSGSDEEELDKWHDMLLSLNEPVSFELKLPWYMVNEWYRIFTGRLKYTVPRLRRWNKGHGRSH